MISSEVDFNYNMNLRQQWQAAADDGGRRQWLTAADDKRPAANDGDGAVGDDGGRRRCWLMTAVVDNGDVTEGGSGRRRQWRATADGGSGQ